MNVAVVIATYGDDEWALKAAGHAFPSALAATARDANVVLHHEHDGTLATARNNGAKRAMEKLDSTKTPDWLCFLDADDTLHPGFMRAMEDAVDEAKSKPGFLLAPAVSYVAPDGSRSEPVIPNQGMWPVLNECVIGTLIHRELFAHVGGFHEWPVYEDWELWLRCVAAGATIVHVPGAVYLANAGDRRNVSNPETYNDIRALHAGLFRKAGGTWG